MHHNMADLVGDEGGARSRAWNIRATDDPTLMVKESEGSFEPWIAGRQPRELKLEVLNRGFDQLHRPVRIGAGPDKLRMETRRCNPDWLERFHEPLKGQADISADLQSDLSCVPL